MLMALDLVLVHGIVIHLNHYTELMINFSSGRVEVKLKSKLILQR